VGVGECLSRVFKHETNLYNMFVTHVYIYMFTRMTTLQNGPYIQTDRQHRFSY